MTDRENIAFEGELLVRREGLWSPWAPRWFSITEDGLLLCSTPPTEITDDEAGPSEAYTIHIHAIEVLPHPTYKSQIVLKLPSRGRSHTIFLKCITYEDRDLWLTALTRAQELAITADPSIKAKQRGSAAGHNTSGLLHAIDDELLTQVDESHRLYKEHKECSDAAQRVVALMKEQHQNSPFEHAIQNLMEKFSSFVAASDSEYNELEKKYNWLLNAENLRESNMNMMAQQLNTLERKTRKMTGIVREKHLDDLDIQMIETTDNETDCDDDFFDAMEIGHESSFSKKMSLGVLDEPVEAEVEALSGDIGNNLQIQYRTELPCDKSDKPLNVWKFLKDCIGKEFSRITMPIILNEPVSGVQRYAEDLENAFLLTKAAKCQDSLERLMYVACFIVAAYNNTARTGKPFNPMLGETFELDVRNDKKFGFRLLAEQVSHHPPITAIYGEGKGWNYYKQVDLKSRFAGKSLEITPVGTVHCHLGEEHFTWNCVKSTVNNIVIGTVWIDSGGEMRIDNHATKEYCILNFHGYSYFGSGETGNVDGVVYAANGAPKWDIKGNWKEFVSSRPYTKKPDDKGWKCRWKRNPLPPRYEKQFYFSKFTIILNQLTSELEKTLPCTDSRFRPDLRSYEEGDLERGQELKTELEEKQRARRREREASGIKWKPRWFELLPDKDLNDEECWTFKKEYFDRDYSHVTQIF